MHHSRRAAKLRVGLRETLLARWAGTASSKDCGAKSNRHGKVTGSSVALQKHIIVRHGIPETTTLASERHWQLLKRESDI